MKKHRKDAMHHKFNAIQRKTNIVQNKLMPTFEKIVVQKTLTNSGMPIFYL